MSESTRQRRIGPPAPSSPWPDSGARRYPGTTDSPADPWAAADPARTGGTGAGSWHRTSWSGDAPSWSPDPWQPAPEPWQPAPDPWQQGRGPDGAGRVPVPAGRTAGRPGDGARSTSPWADDLARTMAAEPERDRSGTGGRSGGGRPGRGRGPGKPPRRRRLRRRLLTGLAGLTVLTLGAGAVVYQQLNGNLQASALFAGLTGDAGTEKPDPFGRVPINVLVIGSDTRASRADCRIGGDCRYAGAGANADVEMVVHVAADRSNATVMSVPRDTVTDLPGCRSPKGATMQAHRGQINSTLAYGPGCTVAAVHQLTGIPIDHFVMVDFSGVVAMADAVGGARVCVTGNVYDNYSHLKLAKGYHNLKGLAALEFVRSRHGFGDGGDLGRTYAQHIFLSAVIRNLKSAGTLTNPVALYGLANAATKALTVDTGLASITSLLGLAADLNKVPTNRITFTTMQNQPDPANGNRVIPAPSAQNLFALIANDQPLTKGKGSRAATSGTGTTTTTPAAATGTDGTGTAGTDPTAVPRSRITVRVQNGSGQAGRASAIAQTLIGMGFSPRTSAATAPMAATMTRLEYGTGQRAQAQTVAAALGLPTTTLQPGTAGRLVLVIGTDWTAGTTFPAGTATGATAPATTTTGADAAALRSAHARTADQAGGCATVSTQRTVMLNGVPMTPGRAYTLSTDVRVSAP